ncbi:MAG: DoxX family protein [Saprospiraceae bacterium]
MSNLSILTIISWVARIAVAIILVQTLYFKFTGAPESKYIFETLGMEPWGRIGSGIMELVAALLILIPRTKALGALLALGIIAGALFSHLTVLGIEVQGDGGLLFYLAVAVFLLSLFVVVVHRSEIPFYERIFPQKI